MEKWHGGTETLVGLQGHLDRRHRQPVGRRCRARYPLPEGLTQTDVLTVVLALTGIGSVVFRKTGPRRGLGEG